jgi:outer membrane protein OmpA-like peptidoglycan-associated protein
MGRVQVIKGGVRGSYAIAEVLSACDTIVPGDYAVPYQEREKPQLKYEGDLDPFALPNGKTTGRIIMSRDFQAFTGTGQEVYLDIGADKGVKVGDYFHITRTYESLLADEADRPSFKATYAEETQANPVKFPSSEMKELPRRTLGTMIILNVHPKSATGMITSSLETIKVGDGVEWFEPPPPPPPPAPPAPTTPTISCTAAPDTVHKGESSTITCQAASPDNHPITIAFNTTAGGLAPRDNTAVLDTAQIEAPATATVTGTVTDDRNQTASSAATVNVQPAAAAPAPTSQQIVFRPRSAYVDNKAKAILDGVALQLTQQADATATVIGRSDKGEPASLAARRADNVKKYLTASKGIDPKRIDTKTSPTPGKLAEVWVVPAGAQLPADAGNTPAPAAPPAPAHHRTAAKKPAAKPAAKPQH